MNKRYFYVKFMLVLIIMQLFPAQFILAQEIIVNPNIALDALPSAELKNIFLGKKALWPNGERIIIVLQKQGAVHDSFLNNYIEMTSVAFRNYWRKRVFTGSGTPPELFDSDREVLQYVATNPGAIGYIANESKPKGIKILAVH